MTDFRELWLLQFAQNLAWLPPPSLAGRLSGYLAATVPQQSLHLSPRATAPHSLCRTHAWAQSPHSLSSSSLGPVLHNWRTGKSQRDRKRASDPLPEC